ncbi:MAG: glycosyltransferase family 2 protein [Isosphaeraceae bacterium]
MLTALCLTTLALSALPAFLFVDNLRRYLAPPPPSPGAPIPSVSVLIPARNEEASIGEAVAAALASVGVDLEVVVLDDHSTDATADVVRAIAERDSRVILRQAPELPNGWCGKQHACASLAALATKPILVFLDADVRLTPDGLARASAFLETSGADLASGIPRQETVGFMERLIIPLIHFVLLGFLPVRRMRVDPSPGYAAGCGQFFITRKSSYERMGGHATIRATLHDGIKLPRAYRAAGLSTDLFDATIVARCRMYRNAGDLWSGLSKNATEGLASPALIGPATVLLLGGQVAPLALSLLSPWLKLSPLALGSVVLASGLSYLPRVLGIVRFGQSVLGASLHPLGVLVLLAIQWSALIREAIGRPSTWKGRSYATRSTG